MDHLPWSNQATRDRPVVRFVSKVENIRLGSRFGSWGSINNWNLSQETSITALAEQAQTWLYFGLLAVILRDNFDLDTLVKDGIVFTTFLHNHLLPDAWEKIAADRSHANEVQSALGVASMLFEQHVVPAAARAGASESPTDVWDWTAHWVLFSVSILIEDLNTTLNMGPTQKWHKSNNRYISATTGMTEALRQVNRCPSLVRRVDLDSRDAFSLLSWEQPCFKTHDQCTMNNCNLFNVDEQQYEPQHQRSCSGLMCQMLGFSHQRLCEIMDSDCVPLVRSTLHADGKISLDLEAGNLDSDYTAISHVWAGGLGNFESNLLHECQLANLHKALDLCYNEPLTSQEDGYALVMSSTIRALRKAKDAVSYFVSGSTSHLYWIDTLCIPIIPTGDRPRAIYGIDYGNATRVKDTYRSKAINSMARIYAGARSILVLDPELQEQSSSKLSQTQLQLAVRCCPWMARSWCLSEGALAIDVNFKFVDTIVPFSEVHQDMRMSNSLVQSIWRQDFEDPWHPAFGMSLTDVFVIEVRHALSGKRDVFDYKLPSLEDRAIWRFVRVWNELSRRTTTKEDDVAVILAALLNLSAGEILKIPSPSGRMRALLKSQLRLPVDIFFCPTIHSKTSTWTPRFPNSDTCPFRLQWSSTMQVRNNNLYITGPTRHYDTLILCTAPAGQAYIQVTRDEPDPRHIDFDDGDSVAASICPGRILLLFSVHVLPSGRKAGRWFRIQEDDPGTLRVSIGNSFSWTYIVHRTAAALQSEGHKVERVDKVAWRPIMVDLDTTDWLSLQWSRLQAFPFVRLGLGKRRPYDVYPMMSYAICILTLLLPLLPLPPFIQGRAGAQHCTNRTSVSKGAFATAFSLLGAFIEPWVVVFSRAMCTIFESGILKRLELRWVQRTWAASFWDVETSTNDHSIPQPPAHSSADGTSSSSEPVELQSLDISGTEAKTTDTMADAALRNSRPEFAIKELIYHLVMAVAMGFSFVWTCRQILFLQCHQQLPKYLQLYEISYPNSKSISLSFLAHFAFATTIEMTIRMGGSIFYLTDWALLAVPKRLALPPPVATLSRALAYGVVAVIAWGGCILIWLALLGNIVTSIFFLVSQARGNSISPILAIYLFIANSANLCVVCVFAMRHRRGVGVAVERAYSFFRHRRMVVAVRNWIWAEAAQHQVRPLDDDAEIEEGRIAL